ncbi:hypothetical protein [Neolewinella persica]|uniref:hypothetical protein n=1 Tax=Neolewinella persica TaxID=70998 RepID=UPI000379C3D7|nr:hypothetical protein [Neolewinella persica]
MSPSKILKTGCKLFLLTLAGLLLYFNASFYYSPNFEDASNGTYNEDVYHQLQHLKGKMHAGAASDMQRLFPEGHLFMNALYGLAWADFAAPISATVSEREQPLLTEAHHEIDWALAEMDSPNGRRIFQEKLPLPYGAFYRGWSNYLRAKQLEVTASDDRSPTAKARLQADCDAIANAFGTTEGPYLESYYGGTWPADNVLAIASLVAYDRTFSTYRYKKTVAEWLAKVQVNLDKKTGLIPHIWFPDQPAQSARGSSQSLMLCLLPEIDPTFAKEQFALYEQHFVTTRLGLPGIREYPAGVDESGDIDSGPVIWGIGGAASVVGQRAAAANGQEDLYLGLRNSLEAFGAAHTLFGEKKYLFGQLPMADAFIAWGNAVEQGPANGRYPKPWGIHLVSLLFLVLLGWLIRKL